MIPIIDLKAQYLDIKSEIDTAISKVFESGQFALGNEVAAFEREFADYCHAGYGVAVNSGTSALHLALLAADVGPGDEVITVPFTFIATVAAICYTGARPVLVDVEPNGYTMDVKQLESSISERTKAILPVHLYGQAAEMDAIMEIAQRHNLSVIEDAAQAHGAEYKGRRLGSIGDFGCFSFYPTKNLGAYGEGGMVLTNDSERARTIRMLRDWGAERKNHHMLKGYNYRMEGLQGAMLRVKLNYLDRWTQLRRDHAASYQKLMEGLAITLPQQLSERKHVYHVYAVLVDKRDQVQQALQRQQIGCAVHYPAPVYMFPAFSDLGYEKGACPVSERIAERELSLPMYPELTEQQKQNVAKAMQLALGN